MEPFKEPARKRVPSDKSIDELMSLLMKLNAKLKEKILSPSKKKENGPGKMDVVIIIMSDQEEKLRPVKTSRPAKPELLKDDWIQGLCAEIEGRPCPPK